MSFRLVFKFAPNEFFTNSESASVLSVVGGVVVVVVVMVVVLLT